jgi:NAD(P)H-flavin reductase
MVPQPWRVVKTRRETRDTSTLELEAIATGQEFSFGPGQFNMLYLFGVGEVPLSMSGDPSMTRRLAHTVRAVGAVSRGIAGAKKGTAIGVRGPFGSYWPVAVAAGGDVLVMAGGIGLAPLRPALYSMIAKRKAYGRIALLYGARTPQDLIYVKELERWRSRFDLDVEVTVDGAAGGWQGNVGVVTALLSRIAFAAANTTAMVCGPEIMMRFAVRELKRRGMAEEKIFLSLERNMKCAIGFCGHCQFGPTFICRDGPVFSYDRIASWFELREI